MKDKVKEDLTDKMVYLKVNCATRIRTNYLAINVRYIDDKVGPVMKTLAVIDTRSRHSSAAIKQMVEDTITRLGIKPTNVVCAITYNAANMVKAVKLMNLDVQAKDQDEMEEQEEEDDDDVEEVEFEEGTLDLHRAYAVRCAHPAAGSAGCS